jgi:hypothetical protein
MDTKRDNAAARTAVTRLLRQYFENLTARLAAGTTQFWGRIEQRLGSAASDPDPKTLPGVTQSPIRQQPAQQQQAKTESKQD